jgi:nucleoside phosphorylase
VENLPLLSTGARLNFTPLKFILYISPLTYKFLGIAEKIFFYMIGNRTTDNRRQMLPFVIERKPIYTHFLNRELLRSVNFGMDDATIGRIFRVLLICTTEHFLSSLAFIWEISSYLPKTLSLIEKLYRANELDLISNLPTVDEFISSSQNLYSYDAVRYPMYFNAIPESLLKMEPGILKEQNTTKVMSTELFAWTEGSQGHTWDLMSSNDKSQLQALRQLIIPVVTNREEKGITLSLFEEALPKKMLEGKKLPLARLLSLIHLQHYLSIVGADIPTGIRGLSYFDAAATSFPVLDVEVLYRFIRRMFASETLDSHQFLDIFLSNRGSVPHAAFVESIRYLVNGALYVTYKRYPHFNPLTQRFLLDEVIKGILSTGSTSQFKVKHGLDIITSAYTDLTQIAILARKDQQFAEFADKWEMEKPMSHKKVLLLTATDLETDIVARTAKSYGLTMSRLHIKDHTIYTLGSLAGTDIFLAQSEMGTEAPGAMTLTANDVVDALKPHSIVLVGIAFGLKKDEQNIGDILVSKQICLYDPKKLLILKGKEVWRARGDKAQSSTRLLDRFRSGRLDWNKCKIHYGLLLSGNTLINSPDFIKKIKEVEPDAMGGEMEGAGIYSVAVKRKIDWIVIKGIADWGIKKSDEFQHAAASNAIHFTFHVISTGSLAS